MVAMGTTDRRVHRADRHGRQLVADLAREIREARVAAGLSQASVGRAAGLSRSRVSRIERGIVARVPLLTLSRLLGVLGLELSARAYPAGQPLRDRAHLHLLERLRSHLHPSIRWQAEAPLPLPGDKRSWDHMLLCGAKRVGVDVETRCGDLQALARRAMTKHRDGGTDSFLLVLSDTRWNRRVVREHADYLASVFPLTGKDALRALEEGRAPEGNALVLL
jgi:transcriptional regulator with XRE-family HTH domain